MNETSFLDGYDRSSPVANEPSAGNGAHLVAFLNLAFIIDIVAALSLTLANLVIHIAAYFLVVFVGIPTLLVARLQADRRAVEDGVLISSGKRRATTFLLVTSLVLCTVISATIAWATA